MRVWIASLSLLVTLCVGADALAQCSGAKTKSCTEGGAAKVAEGGSSCQKDKGACTADGKSGCGEKGAVAADLPALKYKVGDKTTCCPKEAGELAGGDEAKIRFVVAGTEFTKKDEAMKALGTALGKYVEVMQTVQYAVGDQCVACPDAAQSLAKERGEAVKFRVASFTFADKAKAEQAAQAARRAVEQVRMSCVVDGKVCTDEKEASQVCEKGGKSCEFVVGELKTNCPVTAKVELARARIDAARKAVQQLVGA